MSVAVITGSLGLVGSEAAVHFAELGMDVVGIDNEMREQFFGSDAAPTDVLTDRLFATQRYAHNGLDIRRQFQIERLFSGYGKDISLIIHAAAQPSHDWAATDPATDWEINATGTHVMLEAARKFCPDAVFIFLSTNKVYGDHINNWEPIERETRWEMDHPYIVNGVQENFAVDGCLHSLFGASKVSADILVQEYGRYFGMKTACFRCGCITGPNHAGVEAHGFLSYLMKCAITGKSYTVYGYKGKQVRDNIHSKDLVKAFELFHANPRSGEVYNMGGGREANCSLLEARQMASEITSNGLDWGEYQTGHRIGDHIWGISDTSKFKSHYPGWKINYTIPEILKEIYERWKR